VINKDEIIAIADETGLTPNVVEKDHVLGWLLAAVATGLPGSLGLPQRLPSTSTKRRSSSRRGTANLSNGPTYIYRCPMCDKKFKRKTQNSKLNPHKNKDGLPCSGRTGYFENTVY